MSAEWRLDAGARAGETRPCGHVEPRAADGTVLHAVTRDRLEEFRLATADAARSGRSRVDGGSRRAVAGGRPLPDRKVGGEVFCGSDTGGAGGVPASNVSGSVVCGED